MSNFPIQDPHLAHLSELLHRMCVCNTRAPVQAMAAEALRDLRRYVEIHPELSQPSATSQSSSARFSHE